MGVNKFVDRTTEEFKQFLGYNKAQRAQFNLVDELNIISDEQEFLGNNEKKSVDHPKSFDWRNKGVVSKVKNQGSCGSCWAFASTEALESAAAINGGALEILSPQQLVDCAPNPDECGGTGGCQGSTGQLAYQYLKAAPGLASEETYQYTAKDETCKFNETSTPAVVSITGWKTLKMNDYDAVMDGLVNEGPMAIAVDASKWSFYEMGVFDTCDYHENVDINHLVQLVGYGGESDGERYWTIRNSWGEGWGEAGFMNIVREKRTKCGTDKTPSHGVKCKGDDTPYEVCGCSGMLSDVVWPLGAKVLG